MRSSVEDWWPLETVRLALPAGRERKKMRGAVHDMRRDRRGTAVPGSDQLADRVLLFEEVHRAAAAVGYG
jgi:hypothetical protein